MWNSRSLGRALSCPLRWRMRTVCVTCPNVAHLPCSLCPRVLQPDHRGSNADVAHMPVPTSRLSPQTHRLLPAGFGFCSAPAHPTCPSAQTGPCSFGQPEGRRLPGRFPAPGAGRSPWLVAASLRLLPPSARGLPTWTSVIGNNSPAPFQMGRMISLVSQG